MSGLRARVAGRPALLLVALAILVVALSSACKSATDSGCTYNETTNECT